MLLYSRKKSVLLLFSLSSRRHVPGTRTADDNGRKNRFSSHFCPSSPTFFFPVPHTSDSILLTLTRFHTILPANASETSPHHILKRNATTKQRESKPPKQVKPYGESVCCSPTDHPPYYLSHSPALSYSSLPLNDSPRRGN